MTDHTDISDTVTSSSLHAFSSLSAFFGQTNPIDRRIGLGAIAIFFCFFFLWNKLILYLTRQRKEWGSYWRYRNLIVSWSHAFGCGIWDLTVFFVSFNALVADMIVFQSMAAYLLVSYSAGYFLFDLYDMWMFRKVRREAGELWELVLHHIAIAGMFLYNMMANQSIGYNVIALLAEVNSFFLHSRKLLQMNGHNFHNSRLYTANALLNIITFVICRFGSMYQICLAIFMEYDRVSTTYLVCISSCMFILLAINPVLLYRLVRADIKMWRGRLKSNGGTSESYVVAAPYNGTGNGDIHHRGGNASLKLGRLNGNSIVTHSKGE